MHCCIAENKSAGTQLAAFEALRSLDNDERVAHARVVSFTSPLVVNEISQVSKARFKAKASNVFIEGSQIYNYFFVR